METVLGIRLPPGDDYAESWEIAQHRDDVSRVAEGPLRGESLSALLDNCPGEILGPGLETQRAFPLLVKFLDAHQDLSVQVHPDDARGAILANDQGKTEAWYVIHADPGSLIYAGLRDGVSRGQFTQAIDENKVEPLLHRFTPHPGDCIYVPAGTVHALGAGVLVAEVQQMSDATFRIHDWGRLGADGKPRPLHLEAALECIDFEAGPVNPVVPVRIETSRSARTTRLVECDYFNLDSVSFQDFLEFGSTQNFTILIGMSGRLKIAYEGQEYTLIKGQSLLLPAALGRLGASSQQEAKVLVCTPGSVAVDPGATKDA